MIDQAQARGTRVVWCTIPPRGMGGVNVRAAAATTHALTLNSWIRNTLPVIRPGVRIVDLFSVLADPDFTDQWLPGYVKTDGTHYNSVGALVAGKALAAMMETVIPPLTRVNRSHTNPGALLTGLGLFRGAASGVAPTGWYTATPALVQGLTPRADCIPGRWLKVTVPVGGSFQMSRRIKGAATVGDVVTSAVEIYCENVETPAVPAVGNQCVTFGLSVNGGTTSAIEFSAVNGSDQPHGSAPRKGVLESPPLTLTAALIGTAEQNNGTATGDLQVVVNIRGGGDYYFACATVWKA